MSHRETGDHQDVVYGIHSVREAVGSRAVDFVMITQGYHNPRLQEIVDACRTAGISLRFSPRMAVERAAGTTQHQNVVAVCTPKAYDDISDLVATSSVRCWWRWMAWKIRPTWERSSARWSLPERVAW